MPIGCAILRDFLPPLCNKLSQLFLLVFYRNKLSSWTYVWVMGISRSTLNTEDSPVSHTISSLSLQWIPKISQERMIELLEEKLILDVQMSVCIRLVILSLGASISCKVNRVVRCIRPQSGVDEWKKNQIFLYLASSDTDPTLVSLLLLFLLDKFHDYK